MCVCVEGGTESVIFLNPWANDFKVSLNRQTNMYYLNTLQIAFVKCGGYIHFIFPFIIPGDPSSNTFPI